LASEDNKKSLLQSTLVDLKDSIENNNVEAFSKILPVLKQHAGILEKFHLDVNQYFNMNTLSQDFKNALNRNIEILKNIFPNFATLDMQASFSDIHNKAKSTIENGLNSLFGK
jgi:uncharacterized membrane protein YgaE (UPF0421/DUF939 family)